MNLPTPGADTARASMAHIARLGETPRFWRLRQRDQQRHLGIVKPVSAVDYYLRAAREVIDVGCRAAAQASMSDVGCEVKKARLELGVTDAQAAAAAEVLRKAGVGEGEKYAVLNPGANDVAKRWQIGRASCRERV